MQRELRWVVREEGARSRLDRFLASQLPDQTRSQIQLWIRSGCVLVNGGRNKAGYRIRPGDEIAVRLPQPSAGLPEPEPIPLRILHEDHDLAVIDKPAGLVCHAGAGRRSGTLVNALLHRWKSFETGDPLRPGIVHRLDRFTSGVMVVARNAHAHRTLSHQFKSRSVRKEYIALVFGSVVPAAGTIDAPVGRNPRNRRKISVRARKSRTAVTHYQVTASFGCCTLLKVRPETGRTHQIRVHLSSIGHPVVGDALYGARRRLPAAFQAAVSEMGRFFLHACSLEFNHPCTGERLSFSAPLPRELESVLDKMRSLTSQ
ncbi:MAG: RluA family pseudouridine synthase [Acidobacteria bacterium]|nr:RluA family pseudouridine synthase [Acidobacteriota bacterium]